MTPEPSPIGAASDPAPDGYDDDPHPIRTARSARTAKPGPRSASVAKARVPMLAFAAGALLMGVIVGVYFSGTGATPNASSALPSGHPAITAAPTPTPTPVDAAQIAALTAKVTRDPSDAASLKQLADLYFSAEDWATSASWRSKLVALQPTNTDARLVLGVTYFNASDIAGAEKQWLEVVKIDPKKAEAYYDLGFVYLAKEPSDMVKAREMWTKVVELDPNSQMAQVASNHLSQLASSASPSASSAPTPTKS